jgi:uncharacterized OB-fold protein
MSELSSAPDISGLDVPSDQWTKPFWDATAAGEVMLPSCGNCHHFYWPPGPFCPKCQSQRVEWLPAGQGRIYSFTIMPGQDQSFSVPALIEFPDCGGVRFVAAIVDTPRDKLRIGAEVKLGWSQAANARVPVFHVA